MGLFSKKAKKETAATETVDEKSGRVSPQSATDSNVGFKANPFATPKYSEPPSRDPQESEGSNSGYFPPVQTRMYA